VHDTNAPLPPAKVEEVVTEVEVPAPPAPHSFTLIIDTPDGTVNDADPAVVKVTTVVITKGLINKSISSWNITEEDLSGICRWIIM